EVHLRKVASKRLHRSFATKCRDVSSRVTMTDVRQSRKADVRCEGHSSSVDLKNLVASHLIRDSDLDLPVKSAWTPWSRIDGVRPVSRPDDDNVPSSTHSVHQRKELGDDPSFYLS